MELEKFIHKGVSEDGKVKSGGAVYTKGSVIVIRGSCGVRNCHCSDGYFLTITMPLKNRMVEGIKVKFDSLEELNNALGLKEVNN